MVDAARRLKPAPLRDRPGAWARVGPSFARIQQASSAAARIRTGRLEGLEGRWETKARTVEPGCSYVYARYLGPEDGAA